ncbi:MAG: hypothetical protein QXU67_02235, partial [Candidatus Bathyarchaeia archaeon]
MLSFDDAIGFYPDASKAPEGLIKRSIRDRQSLQRRETEDYLREELLKYEERTSEYWHRDYSSVQAFLKSVEPNRKRWVEALGDFNLPKGELLAEEQFMQT